MRDDSEAFVAFDTSKLRNAVAIAEGGRGEFASDRDVAAFWKRHGIA